MESITVKMYAVYLTISILLTVWVARTLHKNGRLFLIDAFHKNVPLADAVNHLLVVGFYLINIGYIAMALKTGEKLDSLREAIEICSMKVGYVLLILGGMHFMNLYVFSRMRNRAVDEGALPPVAPDQQVTPVAQ